MLTTLEAEMSSEETERERERRVGALKQKRKKERWVSFCLPLRGTETRVVDEAREALGCRAESLVLRIEQHRATVVTQSLLRRELQPVVLTGSVRNKFRILSQKTAS